jgi:two-component system sensor histidine kinase KdpD
MSVATAALVLVVPVVVGVAIGGFWAGVAATGLGFLAYDLLFIPPYYTLDVGAAQNWAALAVYVVVMLLVANVVGRLESERAAARAHAEDLRRIFDLSEVLVRDAPLPEVADAVVSSVRAAFRLSGATLLLPESGGLTLAASSGEPLWPEELERISHADGSPVSIEPSDSRGEAVQLVALVASGGAVGLLALRGLPAEPSRRDLLRAFTNQLALVVERSQLREEALRARLVKESERLAQAMIGAVSHDLRTPLATIKVSASTLLDPIAVLSDGDRQELLGLIDAQADRLDRLVANLLDMNRIRAGTLQLTREVVPVVELVHHALSFLGLVGEDSPVTVEIEAGLPAVDVDPVLIRQVLVNLVDNALRYSPPGSAVTVTARSCGPATVEMAVCDRGPGMSHEEETGVFAMADRRGTGGRAGLGLVIVKAFVEAHGESVGVGPSPGGVGARFSFTLPAVRGSGADEVAP